MRVIVVGINTMDSRWGRNHTLNRLARWMPEWVRHYSFVNCVPDVVGPVYKSSQISAAWVDTALSAGYDRVISLGPFPSSALRRLGVEHFVLPHPSGRNRLLNDPEFERDMVRRLREFLLSGSLPVRDDRSVIGTVQGGPRFRLHQRPSSTISRIRHLRVRLATATLA